MRTGGGGGPSHADVRKKNILLVCIVCCDNKIIQIIIVIIIILVIFWIFKTIETKKVVPCIWPPWINRATFSTLKWVSMHPTINYYIRNHNVSVSNLYPCQASSFLSAQGFKHVDESMNRRVFSHITRSAADVGAHQRVKRI